MDAFVKSFSTYRTVKKAAVLSSALTLDCLDAETSTVTVKGTEINRSNTGDWLIIDGCVFNIKAVKPQNDRTMLTLIAPVDVFSRPLEFFPPSAGQSVGGFILDQLVAGWAECSDPVYQMTYLQVSSSDTTVFAPPELDGSGCFNLSDYCRLMRKSYRVNVVFADAGNRLACSIYKAPPAQRQVIFSDGRSKLQSVDYSSSGVAKLTVFHDVDTGEKDGEGNAVIVRERSEWYLSESSEISQQVPARRAPGQWSTITVSGNADVETKVIETFAKNKANHKLEFWSELDLNVQDDCTFEVYGEILSSYISYKRKASTDRRWYYKSGELATTATEKLRGATK